MPKVFVTHELNKINYAPLLDYGDVIFLTSDEYKPEPTVGDWNVRIKTDIVRKMADYIPGEDYIVTSGSPISILLTGIALAGHIVGGHRGGHKILKWNNQTNRYDLCII